MVSLERLTMKRHPLILSRKLSGFRGKKLRFCDLRREGTASGCVFFRNIIFDSANSRIKPTALKRFGDLVHHETLTTANRGSKIIGGCIETNYAEMALQGYAIPRHSGRLAKVVNGQDLLNYNLKKKDGTKFASRRRRPRNPERIIRSVLSKPTYPEDNIDTTTLLQGAAPINWVTKLSSLNRYISEGAERLRNILGLTHYNEDQILCVIEYPRNHPVSLKNPTALDAGFNYIFWSTGSKGNWGKTVDLETTDGGLPEAVHAPISLTNGFRIKLIGRLDRTAPSINLNAFKRNANKETVRPCRTVCKAVAT